VGCEHAAELEHVMYVYVLFPQDTLAPLPPGRSGLVQGDIVLMRVLSSLASLLHDLAALQAQRKAASLDPSQIGVCMNTSVHTHNINLPLYSVHATIC